MLIYYLQAIARSLKYTNNQLRMQLQTVGGVLINVMHIVIVTQDSHSIIIALMTSVMMMDLYMSKVNVP